MVFLLQTAANLNKLEFKSLGDYEIYNPQALSSTLALFRYHSLGPSGYKSRRSLTFEVQLLYT